MVTRAIPDRANKGRSHLIYVTCSPQAGLEDYTLRFTSAGEYELAGARRQDAVGRGRILEGFFKHRRAWCRSRAKRGCPTAYPAEGDVYTFRTIPESYSAASESVSESKILERGPLRSVIRVRGVLGSAEAPVLEYTACYHFYAAVDA